MDAISYKQKEYLYSYFRSKPPELNLHLHKYYEFLYFISGDATYIVEDNLYKIHPGDILLTRPGELHTIFFQSEKPYERIFMQIHPDNHCGAVCATAERNNVHFQSFTLSGRSVLSNSITHTSGFAFQPSVWTLVAGSVLSHSLRNEVM